MIKILIVDDSQTEVAILRGLFKLEPDMEVVGCAHNGSEAIELNKKLRPDVITMDIVMPIMDGIEAIQHIMSHQPVPIIVISSNLSDRMLNATFKALEVGALIALEKPTNIADPSFESSRKRIVETIRNLSSVHVVKRRHKKKATKSSDITLSHPDDFNLLAIGTSVGGPQALRQILSELPKNFPLPIVVVQHMTPGFIEGFTRYLNNQTPLTIKTASKQEILQPGTVYFAPDKYHLQVIQHNNDLVTNLIEGPPISGFCPSVTVLFESVAKTCKNKAIGLLLTGMGNDGAVGLLELKRAGSHTIIQDKESAVVFGMAGVALAMGAADEIVSLDKIASYLQSLTLKSKQTMV